MIKKYTKIVIDYFKELYLEFGVARYLTKKNLDYAILILILVTGIYLKWEIEDILFAIFLVWHFLHPFTSQTLAKVALFFLSLTPIFLIIKRDASAEQFAVYAYYLLILTVIMAIVEKKKEARSGA